MTLLVVHLALTAAYAGFQWAVRIVVYPQFAQVPPAAFAAYERSHQRRVTRVVGPLFAGQGVTTLALLVARPAGTPLLPVLVGAAGLAVVLAVTALLAVPLHRRLDRGWDAAAHRRLLSVDGVRAGAATASTAAAAWALLAT
ncbi:DUF1772 domain-containing protein [Blastococcus sp. VKM Ac-2987]|uniref:DUF1772 domain-containing protein n=1 Tax=Blastococcus sp. VKM Ac-2987 TaxID=3004141 RepID=UPI0022AB6ABA|nr:DUF1772 domain-containing protein [Blastococcus sp. VKM Ac-2987]MCZ2860279.1 DUF1772 domain-containing protein [Blastococcus sp. VKM Ac-2987]